MAAFSWARGPEPSQIYVLGGTDGCLLMSDLWLVDFRLEVPGVQRQDCDFDFATAMGALVYRKEDKTLHHIGGVNSGGINYWMKLSDMEWIESERKHSLAANASSLELTENSSIYFA